MSSHKGNTVTILLDGKPVGLQGGEDVREDGTVFVQENRLYKLVGGSDYAEHTLEIKVDGPGLEAYAFTFG
jgi:hypothetical protein